MRLIDADALKEDIANNVYMVADYFNSKDFGMFWTGGIEKIIDEQPTVSENCWIPVTERLPEDGQWALFTDGIAVGTERYKQDALDHFWPAGRFFKLEEATAWMPLPEPWREEE